MIDRSLLYTSYLWAITIYAAIDRSLLYASYLFAVQIGIPTVMPSGVLSVVSVSSGFLPNTSESKYTGRPLDGAATLADCMCHLVDGRLLRVAAVVMAPCIALNLVRINATSNSSASAELSREIALGAALSLD